MKHMTIQIIEMSVNQWHKVQDSSVQRDTDKHARLIAKHLKSNPQLDHMLVKAARMPNGDLIKIDGHTRSLLWENGVVTPYRETVTVTVFPVNDTKEAIDLYFRENNAITTKTSTDNIFGAFRSIGFSPESSALKRGKLKTALQIAQCQNLASELDLTLLWEQELREIDEWGITEQGVGSSAGLIAAALLSSRKHKDLAHVFWTKYQNDQGLKTERGRCGAQMLRETILEKKSTRSHIGRQSSEAICDIALGAFEQFMQNKILKRASKPVSHKTYLSN